MNKNKVLLKIKITIINIIITKKLIKEHIIQMII